MDEYHNRALPERDDSEYAVIPWMVDFAYIIRKVSVQIYHSRITLQEKLHLALQIENELDRWMARLPDRIKPDIVQRATGGALRDPKWARRQRLVLGIRKGSSCTSYSVSRVATNLFPIRLLQCEDAPLPTISQLLHTQITTYAYGTGRNDCQMSRRSNENHPSHLRYLPNPHILPLLVCLSCPYLYPPSLAPINPKSGGTTPHMSCSLHPPSSSPCPN